MVVIPRCARARERDAETRAMRAMCRHAVTMPEMDSRDGDDGDARRARARWWSRVRASGARVGVV